MKPLFVTRFSGQDYEAHLVVDTVYQNRSAGGVRIASDIDVEEVRDLAREMSFKYAFFGLPRGGAKAGIRLPDDISKEARDSALDDFGRRLAPFVHGGIYYPGMDMNCSPADLVRIYAGAGIGIGAPTDSSWFTALSVASSLAAMDETLDGPRPLTLTVDGFGRVAGHLASILPADRFRFVAISTLDGAILNPEGWDHAVLAQARDANGDGCVRVIPGEGSTRDGMFAFPVDIFLPGSRTRSLDLPRAERMEARAVVPIANAAYADGVLAMLHARGILALPGYLVNGGGVLGSSLYDRGMGKAEVRQVFESRHRGLVARVLAVAAGSGRSPVQVADALAEGHLRAREDETPPSSWIAAVDRRLARRYPIGVKRVQARRFCAHAFGTLDAELGALERS